MAKKTRHARARTPAHTRRHHARADKLNRRPALEHDAVRPKHITGGDGQVDLP